ncbi:MAG: rhodanese-like domain-containing protein [Casimicrobiaceae bacterium]
MRQITPVALKEQLDGGGNAPFLLDVREPREFEYCRIEGSVLIPMGELQQRAGELPQDRGIVAICHHGMRSFQVAQFLRQSRGLDVTNLQGGVAAWARDVDPAMKQY